MGRSVTGLTGRPRLLRIAEFWFPVVGYIALIFSLSGIPQLPTPTRWEYSDKVAHVIEYGILGWLFYRGFRSSFRFTLKGSVLVMSVSLGFLVGAVDEAFQAFVPGRQSSLVDLAADFVGLILVCVVVSNIQHLARLRGVRGSAVSK